MRIAVFLLVLAAMVSAFGVQADYIDVKDTGDENLEALNVAIFIDCDYKNITVQVEGQDSEEPVDGADVYLFYTDYGYQPIKRFATDSEGLGRTDVPGTLDYLTGLFILRVDKSGYQSREIEFAYEKCFQEPPAPVSPPAEEPEETTPPAVKPPAEQPPAEEVIPPEEAPVNVSPPGGEEAPAPGPAPAACPLGMAVLSLLFLKTRY